MSTKPKQSFADVPQNRCSWKFSKFHRKTPVLESLFNNVAGLKACFYGTTPVVASYQSLLKTRPYVSNSKCFVKLWLVIWWSSHQSAVQKMKFSIWNVFSKCDQIRRKPQIWSHLLKKSLLENLFFWAVKRSKARKIYKDQGKKEVIKKHLMLTFQRKNPLKYRQT